MLKECKLFLRKNGQVALSLVFLIGGVVLLVGVTLVFLVYSFLISSSGLQASNRALAVALAGANDALVHLSRDRLFAGPGGLGPNCMSYNFLAGGDVALMLVAQEESINCMDWQSLPFVPPSGQVFVDADATVSGRRRLIEMVLSVNRSTGEVRVISLKQKSGN